ncbi:MAG TPA: hypothetical protein VIY86_00860, partial [Pirellulaceae bacterium]
MRNGMTSSNLAAGRGMRPSSHCGTIPRGAVCGYRWDFRLSNMGTCIMHGACRSLATICMVLAIAGSGASDARAQGRWWDGGSGNWGTLTNWSESSAATTPNPTDIDNKNLTFNVANQNINQSISLGSNRT